MRLRGNLTMNTKWLPLHLLVWIFTDVMRLVQGVEPIMDQYILVERVPRATSETLTSLPGFGLADCARACSTKRDTCQGFHLISGETYPCVLLEELTGVTEDPNVNIRAYVNTYFEGTRNHYWKKESFSWDQGVAECQSAGMVMVSYPKREKKVNWMNAINPGLLFVGAKKDPADPTQVYDINTNELITVDWEDVPGPASSNILALKSLSKKYGIGPNYATFTAGLLCSEAN